jgi:ribosomal protein S18 acetylase RimI-like enzyme
VHDDNGRAIRLYRKLGFEHITLPALEPVFAAEAQQCRRRRIVMRKHLSAS